MNPKIQAIQLFLHNFKAALNKVAPETAEDKVLVDLLLDIHQKAQRAFEVLRWWGAERNFDAIYEGLFRQCELINEENLKSSAKDVDNKMDNKIDNQINKNADMYISIEHLFKKRPLAYQFAVILQQQKPPSLFPESLVFVDHVNRGAKTITLVHQTQEYYNNLKAVLETVQANPKLANNQQCVWIASLVSEAEVSSDLQYADITDLFLSLFNKEIEQLVLHKNMYGKMNKNILELMGVPNLWIIISLVGLAIAHFGFNVALSPIVIYCAIALLCVALLTIIVAGFFFVSEQYIDYSLREIQSAAFSKAYSADDNSALASYFPEEQITQSSQNEIKMTIKHASAPQFFYNATTDRSKAILESITDSYHATSGMG